MALEEVVLSLNAIPDLTDAQRAALRSLGINRISDLLHFRPVHDAQLIAALAAGRVAHDFEIRPIVDAAHADKTPMELLELAPDVMSGVGGATATALREQFNVRTVKQLAEFEPFFAAQALVAARANAFSEPASAPAELMPTIIGAVQSSYPFSSFINEKTLRLRHVELLYDEDRIHFIDERLAAIFPVRGLGPIFFGARARSLGPSSGAQKLRKIPVPEPEIHLGYAARFRQNWVNMGTFLGEVQHSLALAPGESRNIATIDWKRTHLTRRDEDTNVKELLANDLIHTRALDEVARSVALEHQFGGTGIAAGTASSAAANVVGAAVVGGVAGAIPLAAVGALAGGLVGSVEPVIGNAIGAAAGAAGGALIGFGLGAAVAGGSAMLSSANAQLGVVRSDSTGARAILADVAQDITESTSQKSSSIRSLWSTVFVEDTQAENEKLQTRNVTNYNHSHALTVQYFEVLQHYRSEVQLTSAEPLLFLPFRPLEFTIDLIADYWSLLRTAVVDPDLRRRYDGVLGHFDARAGQFTFGDDDLLVEVVVQVQRVSIFPVAPPEIRLIGLSPAVSRIGAFARFRLDDQERRAAQIRGVQVLRLMPGEPVVVTVQVKVTDSSAGQRFINRSSDRREADDSGSVRFDFNVPGVGPSQEDLQASAEEIERFFNARRYTFTRMLLLSLEREQLIDLVEALIFRRAFEVDINPPGLRPVPGLVPFFPGFSARRPDLGTALGEAARNSVRQVVMGEVMRRQPGIPGTSLSSIDKAIDAVADTLRQAGAVDDARRNAAVDSALAPLAESLKRESVADDASIMTRARQVLIDLGGKLAGDTTLFEEAVPLTAFVDPTPFAITGNTLVFRMRRPTEEIAKRKLVSTTQLNDAATFVDSLATFIETEVAKRNAVVRNIFLPTSGVFAEALLGRANASEKLDVTRFFNWQDSPIPHLAPAIAQLTAGSRAQEPLNVAPNTPGSVLNIINPAAFPDPTGLAGILTAIQNGNIFRDMSKADQLVSVLTNLSQLAAKTAEIAGGLAGDAQANALNAANEIANTVAELAQTPTGQGLKQNLPKPDPSITQPPITTTPPPPVTSGLPVTTFPPPPPVTITPPPVTPPPVTTGPPPPPPVTPPPVTTAPPPPPPTPTPRLRQVRINFRAFVESSAWEVKPSLGRPDLTNPGALTGFFNALLDPSLLLDAFFAGTRCNGQGRGFSRTAGTSMAQVEVTFTIDTQTMEAIDFRGNERREFGTADFYLVTDTDSVAGKPEWFENVKAGKTPIARLSGQRLPLTDSNFDVRLERTGQSPVVRIMLNAAPYVPFTAANLSSAPDVDISLGPVSFSAKDAIESFVRLNVLDLNAEIQIMFEKRADGEINVLISGKHDAFPYYEIYVNNDAPAYRFTPTDNRAPEHLHALTGVREEIATSALTFPLRRLPGEV